MGLKSLNITDIALTTGGTVNILNGAIALPLTAFLTADDACTEYRITGTQALVADFIIAMTGTPDENTRIRFSWTATCTPGAFSVQILGKTIPADYLDKKFSVTLSYSGVAWITEEFNLDLMQLAVIPGDRIVSSSIGTSQLTNKAVSYAKVQDVTAYSMLVRDAGTAGVLSSVAVAAQSLIGRIAAGFVAITATVNGTVLKMTAGNIGFAQVDFTELAGSLALTQIPDNLITSAKVADTLLDEVIVIPVSFETGEACDNRFKMPYAGTVVEIHGVVTKAIAATDDATVIAKNAAGTTMTTGTLTFTASDPLETIETASPSADNTFAAGDVLYLTSAKATAGGKALVSVKVTRS